MTSKLPAALAWALWGLIAYATLSPLDARPTIESQTTLEHAAAFFALGALFCLAYPRHAWLAAIIVIGSAASFELLQLVTPDRHARWLDAWEKMAGGGAGLVAGRLLLNVRRVFRAMT